MAIKFLANGNLEPGLHKVSWQEFVQHFGYTNHRKLLIDGMKLALNLLKKHNCQRVYIDGSFTTKKLVPGDWDGCFDPAGMDLAKMLMEDPIFFDLVPPRKKQKDRFKGEIFRSDARADLAGNTFLDFFQKDKRDLSAKGIVELSLKNYIV
jgi:hypothetical protein